ncbi:MAG: hypothetical protein D6737_00740 [Chloroflexi bacterium]|nr:MAG: hypothetical protein D6737_00740 [Chloroflexota bacterium]
MAMRKQIKIYSIEIGKDNNEIREMRLEQLVNDGWEIITAGGTSAGASTGFVFVILQREIDDEA